MLDVVLLKLGGSLITEKARGGSARRPLIRRLAGEIARAAAAIPERLIVGHGSGTYGHVAAAESGIARGLTSPGQRLGVSRTQLRAAELHHLVLEELLAAGTFPFSLAPSSACLARGGEIEPWDSPPLVRALEQSFLPVVYGDVVMDRDQGVAICSTEQALVALTRGLAGQAIVRRSIWLGETAGVYDAEGATLAELSAASIASHAGALGDAAGTDVTGGIRHRLETVFALAELGVASLLCDGRVPGLLERALRGEAVAGTVVSVASGGVRLNGS
jgi:isopentenyl phosphate kinase